MDHCHSEFGSVSEPKSTLYLVDMSSLNLYSVVLSGFGCPQSLRASWKSGVGGALSAVMFAVNERLEAVVLFCSELNHRNERKYCSTETKVRLRNLEPYSSGAFGLTDASTKCLGTTYIHT